MLVQLCCDPGLSWVRHCLGRAAKHRWLLAGSAGSRRDPALPAPPLSADGLPGARRLQLPCGFMGSCPCGPSHEGTSVFSAQSRWWPKGRRPGPAQPRQLPEPEEVWPRQGTAAPLCHPGPAARGARTRSAIKGCAFRLTSCYPPASLPSRAKELV